MGQSFAIVSFTLASSLVVGYLASLELLVDSLQTVLTCLDFLLLRVIFVLNVLLELLQRCFDF